MMTDSAIESALARARELKSAQPTYAAGFAMMELVHEVKRLRDLGRRPAESYPVCCCDGRECRRGLP